MKIAAVICTLVITSLAEELAPYGPSGWKPDGPAFPLPSFETDQQSNQTQQLPHQAYGIPFNSSPTRNTESPTNFGSFQQSQQLTYKEYIEQETNKNRGFQQQLPKQYPAQHFDNTHDINKQANQLSYRQQLGNLNDYQQLPGAYKNQQFLPEKQVVNDYLPSFNPQFDVRSNTPVTQNLQSHNNLHGQNQNQPNQQNVNDNLASFNTQFDLNNQNNVYGQNQIQPNQQYIPTSPQRNGNQQNFQSANIKPRETPATQNQNNVHGQNQIQPNQQYIPTSHQTNGNQQHFQSANIQPRENSDQNTQQLENYPQFPFEESRERKQIPDQYLPAYDPNVTHIEEKGNRHSGAQTRYSSNFRSQNNGKRLNLETTDEPIPTTYKYDGVYRTIVLNNDDADDIDGSFGRRISTTERRPNKTRRTKEQRHLPTNTKINNINIETEEPDISVSTAVANGQYLRRQNGARRVL